VQLSLRCGKVTHITARTRTLNTNKIDEMVRYRALNRIIYKFSFEALLENFEQRICITMLRNHLFHAVVKSAVILENVSEDE